MTPLADLIFVTSEDDRYLVKGGIGTAVGTLVKAIGESQPGRRIDWLTESPTGKRFVEREGNVWRHYVSRHNHHGRQSLSEFASVMSGELKQLVVSRTHGAPERRLIIEAADWEGLAAGYFREHDDPAILKVSRLHTPLTVCAALNRLRSCEENELQMARERQQLCHSDLLSAPTKYILNRTLEEVLQGANAPPESVVIANCADVPRYAESSSERGAALAELRRLTGLPLPDDAFHIMVLGSLEIRKGTEIIQRAIPGLMDAIPDCHLTWIGHCAASGDLTANSKLDAATFYAGIPSQWHHRVHLAGFIEHARIPGILAAANLYALCYLGDNFPGAVLDVALAGIPLAVLMRGGIPEMVTDSGECLAFALADRSETPPEAQLVKAALQVLADPVAAGKQASRLRDHIASKYEASQISQQVLQVYEQALRNKSGALAGRPVNPAASHLGAGHSPVDSMRDRLDAASARGVVS